MEGWFAVKHGIRKHPIFKGRQDRLGAWVAILDEAAWADTRQNVGGQVVDVMRGELCASQAMLEEITGLSRQQLRTFLELLKSEGVIQTRPATKSTKARTILTLCNYEKYQTPKPSANQRPTKDQPTKEQDNNIPVGTDAKAPVEPVEVNVLSKAVWSAGKPYLASKGVKNPGAMIGRWLSDHKHGEVLDAIASAQKSGTDDPIPYITKALEGAKRQPQAYSQQKYQPQKKPHWLVMKERAEAEQRRANA